MKGGFDGVGFEDNKHVQGLVYENEKFVILKPQTFMNLSGISVRLAMERFRIGSAKQIVIVHDDLQLPLGSFKIKNNGSASGHNGVLDIFRKVALAEKEATRLRIGIGGGTSIQPVARRDFVLSKFNENEKVVLEKTIDNAVECLIALIETRNLGQVMTKFNKRARSE